VNIRTSPFPRWLCIGATLVAVSACGADGNDALGSGAAAAAAAPAAGTQVVNASETEWQIVADRTTVKAGEVTFTATNKGSFNHELLVIRTDLPLGAFAIGDDGKFNEDDESTLNVAESGEYEVGLTKTFTAKLKPGKYQLVCNIPNHYQNGMHIEFTVTA